MGLLAVTVVSGATLVPFYDPARALDSLETLHAGLAWGWLLRALHAYAAHALLVVTLAHLAEILIVGGEARLAAGAWWRTVLLIGVLPAAMLSGYVLRGDAEALGALETWRGLLSALPLVGPLLARFVLGEGEASLAVVALHHVGTLTVVLWLLAAAHGRRLVPETRPVVLAGLLCVALAGLLPLGLGPPSLSAADGGLFHGPWYLLGLQGALLDLPVAAGWLGPLALLLVLGLLRHPPGRRRERRRWLLGALGALALAYVGWSVRLLLARG